MSAMANSDTPALNSDGTLKDASQIEWLHSPSDEHRTISLDDQKKRKRADSADGADDLPSSLKGTAPARRVAGKRVKKLSKNAKLAAGNGELSAAQRNFFKNQFTVGNASQSKGDKGKSAQSTTSKSQAPPPKRRATSAPPSPEKRPAPVALKSNASQSNVPNGGKSNAKKNPVSAHVNDSSDNENENDYASGDEEGDESEDGSEPEDPLARYERMREQIQRERAPARKHFHRGQDSRTQDLRAMFTPGEINNQGTNEVKKGHFCHACIVNGISRKNAFLAGDNSTLRTHISRHWTSHGDMYIEKCKELQIEPHPRAMPKSEDDKPSNGMRQASLDGFVQGVASVKWSKEGLLEHLLDFVLSDDQSFRIVDTEAFRKLLQYQRPATKESDIPHRTKLTEEVIQKANVAIQRLTEEFSNVPSKISITFDAWTSKAYDPYLAITAHYIDAPADKPTEWKLKSKLLGFEELKGSHTGVNIAVKIVEVLDQYEIRDKLGWGTSDNHTANDKALRVLQRSMPSSLIPKWRARDRRIRCMEHTVYISAKAFIEAVNPQTPKNKRSTKNGTVSVEDVDDDDDDDIDDDEAEWVLDWIAENPDEQDPENEVVDFTAGDVLGKALALVNQIRASPQAKQYFALCCESEHVPVIELIKWIRTRWGSMHDLIERFTTCKAAIQKFCVFADEKLPKLKNKNYIDYKLEPDEWKMLDLIQEVLAEPRGAQASFSSETEPTLWRTIPILECLQRRWETMLAIDKFLPVRDAIEKGLEKLRKWYKSLDHSDTYFICLVLHPTIKTRYCKERWDSNSYKAGYASLEKAFDAYYQHPKKPAASSTAGVAPPEESKGAFKGYGADWILSSLNDTPTTPDSSTPDPREELLNYVNSARVPNCDPVEWWGKNADKFPTLARLARDYLAIQGSSVASERSFSSGGLTDTLRRNRMEPFLFGRVQIAKHAYKSRLLDASIEADAHAERKYISI